MVLTEEMSLKETLSVLRLAEREPVSRLAIGSPCRFVRSFDIAVHVILPELVESRAPGLAKYLRRTSPRWGRSWRAW